MNNNRSLAMMKGLINAAKMGASIMDTGLMKKVVGGPVNDRAAKTYYRYLGKRTDEVVAIKKERLRKKKAKKFARATRQKQRRVA